MHKLSCLLAALFLLLAPCGLYAQNAVTDTVATSGIMVSNNKIYVVMVIVLTILAGLIFYVVRLDKKISRIEKEN